ncbi:MAG: RNB domain-containing ribonuclease [Alphaproteobacteria bacterium]|nr:RNB domain-containing ribonuclease [Alphaproteobacteria bacterium]
MTPSNGQDRSDGTGPRREPSVFVAEVLDINEDGDALARPVTRRRETADGEVIILPLVAGVPALAVGDRVLVRIRRHAGGTRRGSVIRRFGRGESGPIVGQLDRDHRGLFLAPLRGGRRIPVHRSGTRNAREGAIVSARPDASGHARVERVLEPAGSTPSPDLLAILGHDIPHVFPSDALTLAASGFPEAADRVDLTQVPFITIDDADARDFDDAVWAGPDRDGGWHLMVAIADVAHHVRAGDALDREARLRGNSVYLPGRVVPMLPEELSNDACSLVPGKDRLCLVADMRIDAGGQRTRHRFLRAVMRSTLRTTYEDVQRVMDGDMDDGVLRARAEPLLGAFRTLRAEAQRRGTLELDVPERQVSLDSDGNAVSIGLRPQYDSHRLIETFMVCANRAAAQTLGEAGRPGVFRVHDPPSPQAMETLRNDLLGMGIPLARGQVIRPKVLNRVLERAASAGTAVPVNLMVLRAQSRACYAPADTGHFGLGIASYTHFTSPIRRYADLLVHRMLIGACNLGTDGAWPGREELGEMCRHVSATERRSLAAERGAIDRYAARQMQEHVGTSLVTTVSGVGRAGLFVAMPDGCPNALLPGRLLPPALAPVWRSGRRAGNSALRVGDEVTVTLEQADPITGRLLVSYVGSTPVSRYRSRAR